MTFITGTVVLRSGFQGVSYDIGEVSSPYVGCDLHYSSLQEPDILSVDNITFFWMASEIGVVTF